MSKNLKYFETDLEVMLGDVITVKKLFFGEITAVVSYVPGQSKVNKNLEYGSVKQWCYSVPEKNDMYICPYFPEEAEFAPKKIRLIQRAEPTAISIGPEEDLFQEEESS